MNTDQWLGLVTGVLFVPEGVKGRAPAILYLSGHSASGFRNAPYMTVILNLVKKGFVVFAIDPVGQCSHGIR